MSVSALLNDGIFIALLLFLALSILGLMMTLTLYFLRRSGLLHHRKRGKRSPSAPGDYRALITPASGDIQGYGINELASSGRFSAAERRAEYRRRGKSPSGVIDGIYNDAYRGNESYNDSYRDWEADA